MLQKNKTLLGCLLMTIICIMGCKKDELASDSLNNTEELFSARDLGKTSNTNTPTTPYQVETEVKRIISEKLGVPLVLVTSSASLTNDLGADDLNLLQIAVEIKNFFNIELGAGDTENLTTAGQWADYVSTKIAPTATMSSHTDYIQPPFPNAGIDVTFTCTIMKRLDGKITEVKNLSASGQSQEYHIYDNQSNIIQTTTTSYSAKTSSLSLIGPTDGPISVTWNGEVTVKVKANGTTTTHKFAVVHRALLPAVAPITNNSFDPIPDNPGGGGTNPNPTFRDRLVNAFVEVYGCAPSAVLDTVLWQTNALGGDELSTIELINKAKNEFGCEIPDEQLELLPTIGDLYQYLLDHHTY